MRPCTRRRARNQSSQVTLCWRGESAANSSRKMPNSLLGTLGRFGKYLASKSCSGARCSHGRCSPGPREPHRKEINLGVKAAPLCVKGSQRSPASISLGDAVARAPHGRPHLPFQCRLQQPEPAATPTLPEASTSRRDKKADSEPSLLTVRVRR